jgi:hypothetical protein
MEIVVLLPALPGPASPRPGRAEAAKGVTMLVLNLRFLLFIPLALAEIFLIWTLWNWFKQSRKRESHTPSRLGDPNPRIFRAS